MAYVKEFVISLTKVQMWFLNLWIIDLYPLKIKQSNVFYTPWMCCFWYKEWKTTLIRPIQHKVHQFSYSSDINDAPLWERVFALYIWKILVQNLTVLTEIPLCSTNKKLQYYSKDF